MDSSSTIFRTKLNNSERGMTLVEVLAVIVLIGLIMAVVAKGVVGKGDSAKAKLNELKMTKLQEALAQYRLDFNLYPAQLGDLIRPSAEVRESGKLFVPLADEGDLKDVYGNDFLYRPENDGRSYALTSLGSDGVQGGEGAKQDLTKRP